MDLCWQILCALGPRRKEQWPHKRLTQTCPWVSRSVWQRRGSMVACCRVGGTECLGPFAGSPHYLHYLPHSMASGQITGREQPNPSTENSIKDLPPIRTKPSFPLSQSFPSRSFHKLLILLHQRADRMKTTITENSPTWSLGPQLSETMSHAVLGHPKRLGHGGEFGQNVVHWRTEW